MHRFEQRQRRGQRQICTLDARATRVPFGFFSRMARSLPSEEWSTPLPRTIVIPNPMAAAALPPSPPSRTHPPFLPHEQSSRTLPCRSPRVVFPPKQIVSPPHPRPVVTTKPGHSPPMVYFEQIGDPRQRVFRVQLPQLLLTGLMDHIIDLADDHARRLPGGWRTDLYSLTKCDMACRDIPGMSKQVKPVFEYICHAIQVLYGCRKVVVDKNQPHILKYSAAEGHTGVELHHDRCDVTANLALSKSTDYEGGGTLLADAGTVIRLEQGEFLLHPGSLVHGGMDISSGTRFLLVTFAYLK